MKQLIITCLAVAATAATLSAQSPNLCGSVIGSSGLESGVYQIPTESDKSFKLLGSTEKATGGGVLCDGVYYVHELDNSMSFYGNARGHAYDIDSWVKLNSAYISGSPSAIFMVSDYAVEPGSNKIFGCAPNASRDGFELNTYIFNPVSTNSECTMIAALDNQLGAMAFDKNGQLYGIDQAGTLYKVDKTSGSLTAVGATSITAKADGAFINYIHSSAVIDPQTGKMYWSVLAENGNSALYEVNLENAQATKLRDFDAGTEVNGLCIMEPEANPQAPAAATDLSVDFASASLSGTIEFKAPGKTYAGDNMEEDLSFRVLANDVEIAKGRVYAKAVKTQPITVAEKGDYELKVICANAYGEGPAAKLKATIGYAAPATPVVTANATSTAYSSSVQLQWEPVTTTADGADLGNVQVSYRVVRYPDEVVIEESTTSTSVYDWNIPQGLNLYRYGVTAIALSTPSEEGLSPKVVTGLAQLPYQESFTDENVTDFYTIIDANNDGKTWSFYSGDMTAEASSEADADDWLITPPLNMRSGNYYKISIDVRARSSQTPGKFEVKFGSAPSSEAMTETVIEPKVVAIDNGKYDTYSGIVKATSSGAGHIGVHALTEAGNWWLLATNLRVSAPYESSVPQAPSELKVVPAKSGALTAEVSCIAPDQTLDGSTIGTLEKIEIFRNGILAETFVNPTPGASVVFSDAVAEKGSYTYTAVATNWSGSGLESETKTFIGINQPAPPASAMAYETGNMGEVTVEWEPATTYIDGSPLDPENVTYNIWTTINGVDTKIKDNLSGTSTTFQIMLPDEPQLFWSFGVTAQTEAGENLQAAMCDQIPVGMPYEAPFEESFANLQTEHMWVRGGSDQMTYWDFASANTFEEVKPQDADNGMIAMFGNYLDSKGHLYSAKISLDGLTKPTLTFYLFNLVDPAHADDNTVEVYIKGSAEKDFSKIETYTLSDFKTEGWHRVEMNLDTWKGQSVQVMFIGTIKHFQYIHLDNIQIRDRFGTDLAIASISAPERLKAGNSADIRVDYANYGLNDADGVVIELYADGTKIDEKKFDKLLTDAKCTTAFTVMHNVTSPERIEYHAGIKTEGDMETGNNASAKVSIITTFPNYPTVSDLIATYTEEASKTINLAWSAPDMNAIFNDDMTEDFEKGRTWTNENLDGWTFVDNDNYGIYGFNFFEVPDYAPQPLSQQSWWIIDDSYEPLNQHFSDPRFYKAHSGHKYLVSMAVTDNEYTPKRSDDWAISPRLNGQAQTISFWAGSMLSDALESMEVLYSTEGTDIGDFKSVTVFNNIPWEWKQYYFDVPEGTNHFALRCITRDGYILMVDDVNFTPANNATSLEIVGYNIYCNGKKINEAPVNALSYSDLNGSDRNAVYNVTAIYSGRGESMFSNDAIPGLSGIDTTLKSALSITTVQGEIIITNTERVHISICSVDGRTIYSAAGNVIDCIAVPAGVYIVVAGEHTRKVVVK